MKTVANGVLPIFPLLQNPVFSLYHTFPISMSTEALIIDSHYITLSRRIIRVAY